jgi:endonuclease G, mitochondrial
MNPREEDKRLKSLEKETYEARKRVRRLVADRQWQLAESDPARRRAYAVRRETKRRVVPSQREAIQGDTIDYQPVSFLVEGAFVRRAIGLVEVNTATASGSGTGFLVSPRLLLTNQHVIGDAMTARSSVVTFDREMDECGMPRATTTYRLDPDACALFSPEATLDYALVALGPRISGEASLQELGFCTISDTPDRHVVGMNVNIIQHPNGWPKTTTLRNNLLTFRTDRTLLYETDTEPGASGSPVFSDGWDVVALHHYGAPTDDTDENGRPIPNKLNEGIRISAIVRDLKAKLPQLPSSVRVLVEEALDLGSGAANDALGARRLSPPRPGNRSAGVATNGGALDEGDTRTNVVNDSVVTASMSGSQNSISSVGGNNMYTSNSSDGTVRITVPLEITVRLGEVGSAVSAKTQVASATHGATPKQLTRANEAIKIDTDYANRSGYDENFIPGAKIPLPALKAADLKASVAPLRSNEPNAASGRLDYEHFSLVLHKTKRLAIYTATNIDGETYLAVDRKTGQVGDAEAEKWFKDTRVSDAFTINQDFYSAWSDYFDRGHLTRRTDPTWGTEVEAERANADTFHFSNCSPQHFRFNQTAKFWQGAERFVLENGVLSIEGDPSNKRICVFQGPIFNDDIDLWADDVQIPSSFFKVIVWKAPSKLKSVGIIVSQLELMNETRKALKPPAQLASIDVSQWRVPIATIEQRTGLDFGKTVREADTIAAGGQPVVGAERGMLMKDWKDLMI